MRFIGNAPVDGEVRAIASGALATGDTVIVNSDGTVSAAAAVSISEAVGTPTAFGSGSGFFNALAFDSNSNRMVIAYRDNSNSNYGTAVVATVNSNNTLTLGTPVTFISSHTQDVAAVFDSSNNKIVICFKDSGSSSHGKAIVGTVDPTDNSIAFGSVATYRAATAARSAPVFDTTSNKIIIPYVLGGSSGEAIVGTVSGTSISFGAIASFNSGTTSFLSAAYDSNNNKTVICYTDSGVSGNPLNAVVATVSGTSISFGSEVTVLSTETQYNSAVFDQSSGKVVVSYMDESNSKYGTSRVGTVSGTSISFGSAVVWEQGESQYISGVYDSVAKQVVLFYNDGDDGSKGKVVSGTVSGTSISYSSATQFEPDNAQSLGAGYASSGKSVVFYHDNGTASRSYVVYQNAYTSTNLTTENFVGFANSGYADGQSAALNSTCTVDKNQSGLTAGQTYYVQTDGTLGTTPADPSVVAGTAISSKSIIVKG
jgi:hypothetical protein